MPLATSSIFVPDFEFVDHAWMSLSSGRVGR